MAYSENQCGSCVYLKDFRCVTELFNGPDYEKGYCEQIGAYYYPDDKICSYYRPRESTPSGCYITTALCQVLGYDDCCSELQILRGFRDNVLQKDEQYKDILFEYDVVGPLISRELEKEDKKIVTLLFNNYIKPITELIKSNNYEEAINKYSSMTRNLEDYYSITFNGEVDKDYDYTTGGHGYSYVKSRKRDI